MGIGKIPPDGLLVFVSEDELIEECMEPIVMLTSGIFVKEALFHSLSV